MCPDVIRVRRDQRGLTLIEMVLFIVIVGVALSGLVSVLASSMRGSADMVSRKQAMAIAEAIVEEIALKPYTYCDPDDPNASDAEAETDCSIPEVSGPETGESRATFDNVNDYIGYAFPSPISDQNNASSFPAGFTVSTLSVAAEALGGIPGTGSLRITVIVDGPNGTSVRLDTYRTRYAPNFAD